MSNSAFDWAPTASPEALRARAEMLRKIREFFAEREVLEVETPLLAAHGVTELHLIPFETRFRDAGSRHAGRRLFLQTSPEFAMKRLLAGGVGSIYQICKAFRNEEQGRLHNPEFTLLEWYRVGFSLEELMAEAEGLLRVLLASSRPAITSTRFTYRDVFRQYVGVDPVAADITELAQQAVRLGYRETAVLCGDDRTIWLDFLFSQYVQPHFAGSGIVVVTDFPRCLPSLARVCPDDPSLVARAEIFLDGIELANGFHELADAQEQASRFDREIAAAGAQGAEIRVKDTRLLAALEAGLPDCSGIALGLDRLLMAITRATHIDEVLSFAFERA